MVGIRRGDKGIAATDAAIMLGIAARTSLLAPPAWQEFYFDKTPPAIIPPSRWSPGRPSSR